MVRTRTAARALLAARKVSEEEGGLDHSEGTWGFADQSASELRGNHPGFLGEFQSSSVDPPL